MARKISTYNRMDERVASLIDEFSKCLDYFESESPFTGPSLEFHQWTIQARRTHATSLLALDDHYFFQMLYATLTAWGMHRMGKNSPTRLTTFDEIMMRV